MRPVAIAVLSAATLAFGCGGATGDGTATDAGTDRTQSGGDGGNRDGSTSDGAADGASSDGGGSEGGSSEGGDDGDADSGPLPTEWTVVATPLDGGVGLYGVGGYTTLDVWAVGGTASGPADIFWSGMLPWANLGLVTSATPLLSVSSQGADDSWTVAGSTVFHWDGTGWHILAMYSNTTPMNAVWADTTGEAIAVGNGGTVLSCSLATSGCTSDVAGSDDLTGIWGVSPSQAWAVSKAGSVYSYAGAGWTQETSAVTTDLHAVAGADMNHVWAVGDSIEVGPGTWTKDKFSPPGTLYGIWAGSPTEAWAVGKGGIIVAWDGARWKSTTSPTTSDLYAIWGANAHDIWAVGANNTVLRRMK
jgi:hypothetical protein